MKKIILLIAIFLLAANACAATLQGSVFEWYSLERINNAIIDINSVPAQRIVAKGGQYSLQLHPGDYLLRAESFENSSLKYEAEETVSIGGDGNFTLDLVMFPALDENESELIDPGINDASIDFPEQNQKPEGNGKAEEESFNLLVAIGATVLLLVMLLAFSFHLELGKRIRKAGEKTKTSGAKETKTIAVPENKKPKESGEALDKYAIEVLDALKKSGNRLTQKELREKVQSVGEAKISLILAELESMGKIKKIKKGRGNIIVLK